MDQATGSAIEQIRLLDEQPLRAVAGQEHEVAAWIVARQSAIERSLRETPTLPLLEELQERTRRVEDRFLHWRRSAIMELSLIEQHLRFLSEQKTGAAGAISTRFILSA
jgi:hypothetical protein